MKKKNSIIIVDDDDIFLSTVKEGFVLDGYRCETAKSAESAIELIERDFFDIMLTDIALPGMKGLELAEQAKKMRPKMVIIVMTGFVDDFSYDSAIEAGASDFIKKPFTMKELNARIEHVKMQEKQRVMAITDELTGLSNRRGFFTLAEQLLKLSKRTKRGIYMFYADVDNLKGINDSLGHQKGDMALVDAAHILKTTYRESDIIARIGGDEFVVIPVGTEGDDVETVTERFLKNLNDYNAKQSRPYKLLMSFGIAYYDPKNPCSVDELLAQGDKLMYRHKRLKKRNA